MKEKRFKKIIEWGKPKWGEEEFNNWHIVYLGIFFMIPIIGQIIFIIAILGAIMDKRVYFIEEKK